MKKGEISTSFLVGVALVIMSGIVLILVFTTFDWKETSDEGACKSSVVLRGTMPEIAKSLTPLTCNTEKICISSGGIFSRGGSCKDSFQGAENVNVERVSSSKFISKDGADAKTEIERIISKKVVECWDMMGSGKISIDSPPISKSFGLGETTSFCVVCSRIDIDDSILERYEIERSDLSGINPFMYMKTRKYPGTKGSYLEYITNSGSGGRGAAFGGYEPFEESGGSKKDFRQLAIVFTQISSPSSEDILKKLSGPSIVGGVGVLKIATVARGATGAALAAAALAIAGGAINMNVLNNQALTASYCGDLTNPHGTVRGCSLVRVIPYDSKELNTYCGVIDGYP
jgi:hypothetical protein